MNQQDIIQFRKVRNWGEVISASLEFTRQNFKMMAKNLLYIVGPIVLVSAVLTVLYQMSLFSMFWQNDDMLRENPVSVALPSSMYRMGTIVIVLAIVSMLVVTLALTVIYDYILLYMDQGPEACEVRDVWQAVKGDFFMMLRTVFGLGSMIGVGTIFVGIIPILGFLALLVALPYVTVSLSLAPFIRMREDVTLGESISRSFSLIKDNWWRTFGILFICALIVWAISTALAMPQYALMMFGMYTNTGGETTGLMRVLMIVATIVPVVGALFLYTIPSVAIAFQYFNLVEQKESPGLLEQVDLFGVSTQSENSDDETY